MTTIDFAFALLGLDGQPLQPEALAGKLLAGVIATQTRGDAIKLHYWAIQLYQGKPLKLDPSDFKTLRELVNESDALTVLAKAQLLDVMDRAQNSQTDKPA